MGNCGLWGGGVSLVAQRVKRLLTIWETQVQSLGREVPLEKEPVKTGVRPYLRLSRPYIAHNRSRDLRNIGGI